MKMMASKSGFYMTITTSVCCKMLQMYWLNEDLTQESVEVYNFIYHIFLLADFVPVEQTGVKYLLILNLFLKSQILYLILREFNGPILFPTNSLNMYMRLSVSCTLCQTFPRHIMDMTSLFFKCVTLA
jgi:hypothetical protein